MCFTENFFQTETAVCSDVCACAHVHATGYAGNSRRYTSVHMLCLCVCVNMFQ